VASGDLCGFRAMILWNCLCSGLEKSMITELHQDFAPTAAALRKPTQTTFIGYAHIMSNKESGYQIVKTHRLGRSKVISFVRERDLNFQFSAESVPIARRETNNIQLAKAEKIFTQFNPLISR
jgi:hypothetical protein